MLKNMVTEVMIQSSIILSIICFSIETLPNLNGNLKLILLCIETIVIGIFSIEYSMNFIRSDNKAKLISSPEAIINLMATLPFYLAIGLDVRTIRIFRLFRLARVLKLKSLNNAISRFSKAYISISSELKVFGIFMLFILYLASAGIYHFEHIAQPESFSSIFHSMWWSITTLTTVGYGDMAPITIGGKMFTFVILIIGLGIVAVPTGLLANALSHSTGDS